MGQLKELPENWVIKTEGENNVLFMKFKKWFNEKSDGGYVFISEYYGVNGFGDYVNFDTKPNQYKIITLEQWDSIVNPKKENTRQETIKNLRHWQETESTHTSKLKVGDKIPEYLNGKIRLFCGVYAPENALYVDDISAGRYYISDHTDADQLAGDDCNQFIQLEISEVDALIEEHEREIEKAEEMVNKHYEKQDNEEWIPQNGKEVNCYDKNGAWIDVGNYIGMDEERYIIKIDTGFDWFADVKPIIIKNYSQIAYLLGISKEQLKIVEDV